MSELRYLPGIGAALAARIVSGRPYATVRELGKVKGLGGDGKRLASVLPYVTTTGATTLSSKAHGTVHAAKKAVERSFRQCATDMQCEQRDLALYLAAARKSILRGLADGTVHFEPSWAGGEYISTGHEVRP